MVAVTFHAPLTDPINQLVCDVCCSLVPVEDQGKHVRWHQRLGA